MNGISNKIYIHEGDFDMGKYKVLENVKLTDTNRLLIEEAIARGVKFERPYKGRIILSYGNKSYVVRNGVVSSSYNTRLAKRCTDLKEVNSRLLRSKGLPAPENAVFDVNELERAWKWAEPILPVVVKPNNSTWGKHVYVNIKDYNEFKYAFEQIANDIKYREVLIEQFCEGEEYRFTFVKDEIVAIAKRIPANVIGDGVSTIEQLVNKKNKERKKRKNPIHKKIKINQEVLRLLKQSGRDLNSIPNKGERVYLRRNSNIATGGDAIDVTDQIDPKIKEVVCQAAMSIPGLRVCGLDVIIDKDNNISIIEINSCAMLSMHHYPWEGTPRNVAEKVIIAMFPELKNKKKKEGFKIFNKFFTKLTN